MNNFITNKEGYRGLIYSAACGGHLDCLVFLYENNYKFEFESSYSAIINGHLKCLEYIHNISLLKKKNYLE